jgi:flagellar biosynthesis GTPase FlhF
MPIASHGVVGLLAGGNTQGTPGLLSQQGTPASVLLSSSLSSSSSSATTMATPYKPPRPAEVIHLLDDSGNHPKRGTAPAATSANKGFKLVEDATSNLIPDPSDNKPMAPSSLPTPPTTINKAASTASTRDKGKATSVNNTTMKKKKDKEEKKKKKDKEEKKKKEEEEEEEEKKKSATVKKVTPKKKKKLDSVEAKKKQCFNAIGSVKLYSDNTDEITSLECIDAWLQSMLYGIKDPGAVLGSTHLPIDIDLAHTSKLHLATLLFMSMTKQHHNQLHNYKNPLACTSVILLNCIIKKPAIETVCNLPYYSTHT